MNDKQIKVYIRLADTNNKDKNAAWWVDKETLEKYDYQDILDEVYDEFFRHGVFQLDKSFYDVESDVWGWRWITIK